MKKSKKTKRRSKSIYTEVILIGQEMIDVYSSSTSYDSGEFVDIEFETHLCIPVNVSQEVVDGEEQM